MMYICMTSDYICNIVIGIIHHLLMAALVLDDAIANFLEHILLYRAKNITHREKVFEFEIFKKCDVFFGL